MVIILYMVNDIKEDQGHFIMFHRMLNNLDALLLEEIVKCFHYELKQKFYPEISVKYLAQYTLVL